MSNSLKITEHPPAEQRFRRGESYAGEAARINAKYNVQHSQTKRGAIDNIAKNNKSIDKIYAKMVLCKQGGIMKQFWGVSEKKIRR